jgi:SPP1 gp7 family putative phage head morphogenesis protein
LATRDLNKLYASATRSLERTIAQTERELQKVYRDVLKEIQAEIAGYYEKYAVDGVLTRAEMTKYNRRANLEKQLNTLIGNATQRTRAATRRLQATEYNESFFRHAWAIEQHIGVGIGWGTINEDTIRAIVNNDIKLIAEERLRNMGRERIRRTIAQGLTRGDSFPAMARGIRQAINGQMSDAMRIVRTEGMRAMTQGSQATYDRAKEKGIEGVETWVATLDGRTRDSHQAMDGQEADENGLFTLPSGATTPGPHQSGIPEEDINCRCRTVYRIAELSPRLRRIRDEGVQPYQTYDEWARTREGA